MYDDIYYYLAVNFYSIKMEDYIVVDEKEYKKRLICGQIDYFQKKIYDSKCFSNKPFLEKMIDLHSLFFQFVPESYKNDYDYVLYLLDINPNIYEHIPMKDDDKILKKVLKENPYMLKYAPFEIQDNEEYVKLTCDKEKDNKVVRYASPRLREKYGYYSSSVLLWKKNLCR